MNKKSKRKKITGSLLAKITIFILMILCVGVGTFSAYTAIWALVEDVYEEPFDLHLNDAFYWQAREDQSAIYNMIANQEEYDRIADYCRGKNIRAEIFKNGIAVWSNYDSEETVVGKGDAVHSDSEIGSTNPEIADGNGAEVFVYEYDDFPPIERVNEMTGRTWEENIGITLYVDTALPYVDEYYYIWRYETMLYQYVDPLPAVACGAVFAVLLCFIFLMCSAGHRNEPFADGDGKPGRDETVDPMDADRTVDTGTHDTGAPVAAKRGRIYPGFLQGVWLDVLLALLIVLLAGITEIAINYMGGYSLIKTFWVNGIIITIWAMLTAFFGTIFCMELAIRMKRGGFYKHTLIYTVLRFIVRCIKAVGRGIMAVLGSLPVLMSSLAAFAALSVCEFIGICLLDSSRGLCAVWFFERILIVAVICYFGLVRGKLQKASRALAEGDLCYHVDTSKMILGYKEHGDNLNSIGEGMAKAVSERMKSEHLKTELITNVSHDLKTPLTSIINYSDLLGQAGMEPEKVREYTEVLHRQSVRLKKLLDDLLEVSKASTGNLSADLVSCDVKVLVTQTTGEYEQRFSEKNLTLIVDEPEEDVHIMADHRHIFRIFDNLLGNICKYAQPGTRVYLNVENIENKVRIIFRNMSEYPLNIDGEELAERFVRGDKSRHKEGSGLGLSIAMSLAQLQGGSLNIITDGDLFKAVLEFPMQRG